MTSLTKQSPSRRTWTIAALCSGTALSGLNSGMIAVALTTIRGDFKLDVASVMWVITVFYLAMAVLQPLMGRLADRYGPRRLFVFGMVVIALAGILAPLGDSFIIVCIARVLLAIGTSTAFPAAVAMLHGIAETTGGSAPKMIGRIQMIDTGAMAVGPLVGGLLVTQLGWESIFLINIPLAAIAAASTLLLAPKDPEREKSPIRTTLVESDIPGVLLFGVTIVALLMFLLDIPTDPNWWLIPIVVLAGALFAWRELHCTKPFIDLRLLAANTALIRVYVLFGLVNMVFYGALFGVPQYLEDQGFRTDAVGLLVLPLAAATVLLTPLVERLIDRRGLRNALIIGGVGFFVSAMILGFLALSTAPVVVLLVAGAMGIPYAILTISLTQSLYVAARPGETGEAAGLFQTARCLGGISSTVIVGISFANGTGPVDWLAIAGTVTVLAFGYLVLAWIWRKDKAPA